MKRKIIILLLLAALACVGLWIWQAQRGRDAGELVLYGNVDIREVSLAFRVSGKIKEVLKDEGDRVMPGEVIARLDAEPYQRELEQAQAQAASLKANVEMMVNGYRRENIAQARAALAEREASLANVARLFERQRDLLRTKVTSQQEYDDAAARLKEAEAQLNSARAALELQEAGYRPEEIAQGKAELAKAEAALETARIQLADTELKSPSAGIVITRAREPGAIVQAGATVLTVSLEDPVWARVYVDEPHLGFFHPGAAVEVFTDSRRSQPYHGQVGYVSPRAEFTPKSVETTELRTSLVYRLRVVITDPDPSLRQGMPVTVKISAR
jgi:HlyD family secretion protein